MVEMIQLKDRNEWLECRRKIGGSDSSSVVGLNPYISNVDLWKIKTGQMQQADISDLPYVKYGTEAESHLRELFALDYPQYKVDYVDNNIWTNDKYHFAHASLDGWLTEIETGRKGIWECKTTNILNSTMKAKWENRIPDNYYCQLLHYFMVTEFEFAVLKAQLKWKIGEDVFLQTKHYKIERSDVESDIEFLAEQERIFWKMVEEKKMPSLKLPDI